MGKSTMATLAAAALGGVLACATPARAGVVMTMETREVTAAAGESGSKAAARQGRTFVDGDRLRMESADGVMIFRADRDAIWALDTREQAYTEIDRGTLKQMRGHLDAARAQMKAELEKLPPEQRAQMEQMMEAHGMGAEPAEAPPRPKYTVKPTGKRDTVAGLACREVEVLRDGEKEGEACVADWASAGVAKADLAVFGKFAAFQEAMRESGRAGRAPAREQDVSALFDELDGVPVRLRRFVGGKAATEMRIVEIVKQPLDAGLFEVPSRYTKRVIPGHGAGRSAPPHE